MAQIQAPPTVASSQKTTSAGENLMENTGNRRIIIAGSSGILGLNLAGHLYDNGFEPVLLSRHAPTEPCVWRHIKWDG